MTEHQRAARAPAAPVLLLSVPATAAAAWAVVDGRTRLAGGAVLVAGLLLLTGGAVARRAGSVRDRVLDSVLDRTVDGAVLSSIAWAARDVDVSTAVAALVALVAGSIAAYVRARGQSLAYTVTESPVTRGLRYALLAGGLLAARVALGVWAVATLAVLAGLVRASQVAKEERA